MGFLSTGTSSNSQSRGERLPPGLAVGNIPEQSMYEASTFALFRIMFGVRDPAESAFESNDHTSAQM